MRKCPIGWKSFPDKLEADLALANIRMRSATRKRKMRDKPLPVRSYRHGLCGNWHLTAMAEGEGTKALTS